MWPLSNATMLPLDAFKTASLKHIVFVVLLLMTPVQWFGCSFAWLFIMVTAVMLGRALHWTASSESPPSQVTMDRFRGWETSLAGVLPVQGHFLHHADSVACNFAPNTWRCCTPAIYFQEHRTALCPVSDTSQARGAGPPHVLNSSTRACRLRRCMWAA